MTEDKRNDGPAAVAGFVMGVLIGVIIGMVVDIAISCPDGEKVLVVARTYIQAGLPPTLLTCNRCGEEVELTGEHHKHIKHISKNAWYVWCTNKATWETNK